jgi:hypothetical protein
VLDCSIPPVNIVYFEPETRMTRPIQFLQSFDFSLSLVKGIHMQFEYRLNSTYTYHIYSYYYSLLNIIAPHTKADTCARLALYIWFTLQFFTLKAETSPHRFPQFGAAVYPRLGHDASLTAAACILAIVAAYSVAKLAIS